MFRLLTKFKTQSLNEVKPYESNGSIVSVGQGEILEDDGIQQQTWQQEVCRTESENTDTASKDLIRTPFHTRMPNVHVRTLHFLNEPNKEDESTKTEDKENGEKLAGQGFPASNRGVFAEKRKWSDVKRSRFPKQNFSNDSSSSDDEVKELFSKQHRSCNSNPNGNDDIRQKSSPIRNAKIRPSDSHTRKRHRMTAHERLYSRPSLDFEKMQQKVFWKRSAYGSARPRIVKVRSFAGHPHLLDSSLMTFQPIQGIQAFKLPPVEETRSLAY
ncbi:uncharacterized protein LOC114522066 [Dendronephthya gigantea]|uniref:uncharacterized protein LOC114522066 n=1 Tax=Dendronephthya gigantea TaxID=151771 RepID=UPI00106AC59B|nr:uncharacterized protein LOC114522066 [Dendronephthya gigantea]XP_028398485.1 uncharacterized protein LOC114522066 [Dendronephthya gigantea]